MEQSVISSFLSPACPIKEAHCSPLSIWHFSRDYAAAGSCGTFYRLCRHRIRPCQRAEHLFAGAATRTFPVVSKILKSCSRRNFPLFITPGWIVNISAISGLALPHIFWFWTWHIVLPKNSQKLFLTNSNCWQMCKAHGYKKFGKYFNLNQHCPIVVSQWKS